MKTQVVIIGGGTTFDTYEDFLEHLKTKTIDIERLKPGFDWKFGLQDALGEQYEVLAPQMPNRTNAQYAEWKIWFERILEALSDHVIFIGHSLGGIFLAKYMSENTITPKPRATFLLAAPFTDTPDESISSFALLQSLAGLEEQGGKLFLYHSTDDPVVPFEHVKMYTDALPEATLRTFEDKSHFFNQDFPELVEDIQKI